MGKHHEHSDTSKGEKYTLNGDAKNTGPRGCGDAVETECGYGSWKPTCLQVCNNTKFALLVLSIFAVIQGFVVNGIVSTNTTSLERRFGFSSLEVSFIAAAYEISAGLFVIPIGYYGRLGHKPRWLAVTCFIMGLGSCVMFLPHYITGQYDISRDAGDLCLGNSSICSVKNDVIGGRNLHLAIFIIGQFLHGIGGASIFTLGIIWLDDSVKLHQLPIYVGIAEAMSALGPAIGYVLGGVFLDIYVDVDSVDTNTLTINPSDPRWVGAWWIGLVVSGGMGLICSLFLFCFGWELPEAAENRKGRVSQAHNDGSEQVTMKPGFGMTIKDLPKSTLLLLKNPTFMFLNCAGITAMMLVTAYAVFMPKFVQNQFQQTATWAALLTGFVAIPGIAGGQLAGGIIPAKMKLRIRGMIILSIVSFVICLLPMPVLFARCSPTRSAGINAAYGNSSLMSPVGTINLTASCNAGCSCSTKTREPLCGADGVEYFSGCYAGCTGYNYSGTGEEQMRNYTNCACIGDNLDQQSAPPTGTSGLCPTSCDLLIPFLLLMFVVSFTLLLPLTPLVTVTLRVVPDNLRGYALAVQWVFIRFFGSFPGPILFGLVLDSSCVIWQDRCGERGSCWLYDSFRMSWTVFVFSLAMGIASLIFMTLALISYKPPPPEESGIESNDTKVTEVEKRNLESNLTEKSNLNENGVKMYSNVIGEETLTHRPKATPNERLLS